MNAGVGTGESVLRPLVYNSDACDFSLARGFGDREVFRMSYASELKECARSHRFMIVSLDCKVTHSRTCALKDAVHACSFSTFLRLDDPLIRFHGVSITWHEIIGA